MSEDRVRIAPAFLQSAFSPDDRLAIVLVDRHARSALQRIARARDIAAPEFQAWLRKRNARGSEVYVSMNPLREGAAGRTKAEIGYVRHIYLDFDVDGAVAAKRLQERADVPPPNFLVTTSPNKRQVIWSVEGFSIQAAEALQRGLAAEFGADMAATDASRVLRLPGFRNNKYERPPLVSFRALTAEVYRPERFPVLPEPEVPARSTGGSGNFTQGAGRLSQSERDWAFARRALSRGESEKDLVALIAAFRPDKPDPQYYAELTIRKAQESFRSEARPSLPER